MGPHFYFGSWKNFPPKLFLLKVLVLVNKYFLSKYSWLIQVVTPIHSSWVKAQKRDLYHGCMTTKISNREIIMNLYMFEKVQLSYGVSHEKYTSIFKLIFLRFCSLINLKVCWRILEFIFWLFQAYFLMLFCMSEDVGRSD